MRRSGSRVCAEPQVPSSRDGRTERNVVSSDGRAMLPFSCLSSSKERKQQQGGAQARSEIAEFYE